MVGGGGGCEWVEGGGCSVIENPLILDFLNAGKLHLQFINNYFFQTFYVT